MNVLCAAITKIFNNGSSFFLRLRTILTTLIYIYTFKFVTLATNVFLCCNAWILLVKKSSTIDMTSSCDIFSQWTFQPLLVHKHRHILCCILIFAILFNFWSFYFLILTTDLKKAAYLEWEIVYAMGLILWNPNQLNKSCCIGMTRFSSSPRMLIVKSCPDSRSR